MTESEAPILDERVLTELGVSVGGDRAFVVDLVGTFLADGATQLSAIEAASNAGDADALVRPAHTLKSSSATVGAMRLAASARELEVAGRSGRLDAGAATAVDRLRVDWDSASAALRTWLAGSDR